MIINVYNDDYVVTLVVVVVTAAVAARWWWLNGTDLQKVCAAAAAAAQATPWQVYESVCKWMKWSYHLHTALLAQLYFSLSLSLSPFLPLSLSPLLLTLCCSWTLKNDFKSSVIVLKIYRANVRFESEVSFFCLRCQHLILLVIFIDRIWDIALIDLSGMHIYNTINIAMKYLRFLVL